MNPRDEHGSVALLVLAGGVVLLSTGLLVLSVVTDVGVAAARARTAADAAALAAVGTAPLLGGNGDACAAARRTAEANGAEVLRCMLGEATTGGSPQPAAQVEVEVPPAGSLARAVVPAVPARAAAALRPRDAVDRP